ncbi:MAG: XdhC family protein [Pseudomonadota bacterium]
MNVQMHNLLTAQDPIQAILDGPGDAVLTVIAGVEGPSYRPVGAMMAVFPGGERTGTLSSGCIEADIAHHAETVLKEGKTTLLRYGRGSPFIDIQLPCGGGLDILLVPRPDRAALSRVLEHRTSRIPCTLEIDTASGAMAVQPSGQTEFRDGILHILFEPEINFLVFGKGPEATTFASLVQAAGYPNTLLSPDTETLDIAKAAGCGTKQLLNRAFPVDLASDDRTAVVLFFHDHDWEPPLLAGALDTDAFYIGAQGSQRARDARMLELEGMGISEDARARLTGPVGLIPSARDPGTLAVSVLAEILATAKATS